MTDTPMSALEIIRHYKQEAKVPGAQGPQTDRETPQNRQHTIGVPPNDQSKSDPQQLDYKAIIGKEGSKLEREGAQQKHADYQNYVKKLTLAQKRGLVKPPEPPLTLEQWQKVLEQAKQRAVNQQTCPICMDDFKLKPQVVLNCSHFFHHDCLKSFEAHSHSKKCPVCRQE